MTHASLSSLSLAVVLAVACSRAPPEDRASSASAESAARPQTQRASLQHDPTRTAARIPLVPGLTVVTAIAETGVGDYESVKQITEVTDTAVSLTYSADIPGGDLDSLLGGSGEGEVRHVRGRRELLREDLTSAREYMHLFGDERMPEKIPGSTALGVSTAVLDDLKNKGVSPLTMRSGGIGVGLGGLIGAFGGADFSKVKEIRNLEDVDKVTGTIRRVESSPVPLRVLVNGQPVDLPAIHAKGELGDRDSDFYFLDDSANPLALKWSFGDDRLQVIKIAFPETEASSAKPAQIEADLEKTGRAEVYGIYFDFNSDVLRPESQPVLEEIAAALREHAEWQLRVEGHTDNVGTDTHNLDLSLRRAAAVKKALVDRYQISDGRLAPAGFGASRPKDTNDTVEGRARNRRVELARQE